MTTAYPLCWPAGWPRTSPLSREVGRFSKKSNGSSTGITISQATARVLDELGRMGVADYEVIISTNVRTRNDGLPRGGEKAPHDPGVAVYFRVTGVRKVIPCDKYRHVEQNMAAVAATIEALRALDRHGSGIMERAFTGFEALPAPAQKTWWEVFDCEPDDPPECVKALYQRMRSFWHPDKPTGDEEIFREVQWAWEEYQRQMGAQDDAR